jgi:hypothetical protein
MTRVFEKTVSNMQEVAARGGKIILITDEKGAEHGRPVKSLATIVLPDVPRSSRRSSMPCRCSCSPITPPSSWARMSTSRAISRNR